MCVFLGLCCCSVCYDSYSRYGRVCVGKIQAKVLENGEQRDTQLRIIHQHIWSWSRWEYKTKCDCVSSNGACAGAWTWHASAWLCSVQAESVKRRHRRQIKDKLTEEDMKVFDRVSKHNVDVTRIAMSKVVFAAIDADSSGEISIGGYCVSRVFASPAVC